MTETPRRLTRRQRLGGVALAVVAGAVFGNGLVEQEADEAVPPAPLHDSKSALGAAAPASAPGAGVLALDKLRRRVASADVADLFAGPGWHPKPPPPAPEPPAAPPAPPAPPRAPALPFAYIGQMEEQGQGTVYYLERGPQVLVVAAGDTIDGTYRVEGAREGQLEFTFLPLGTRQGLPIGE